MTVVKSQTRFESPNWEAGLFIADRTEDKLPGGPCCDVRLNLRSKSNGNSNLEHVICPQSLDSKESLRVAENIRLAVAAVLIDLGMTEMTPGEFVYVPKDGEPMPETIERKFSSYANVYWHDLKRVDCFVLDEELKDFGVEELLGKLRLVRETQETIFKAGVDSFDTAMSLLYGLRDILDQRGYRDAFGSNRNGQRMELVDAIFVHKPKLVAVS